MPLDIGEVKNPGIQANVGPFLKTVNPAHWHAGYQRLKENRTLVTDPTHYEALALKLIHIIRIP